MQNFSKFLPFYAALVTIALAGALASCKTFDTASTQHLIENTQKLKMLYCSEAMRETRDSILAKIRVNHPEYPEHGFCGYFVMPESTITAPADIAPENVG